MVLVRGAVEPSWAGATVSPVPVLEAAELDAAELDAAERDTARLDAAKFLDAEKSGDCLSDGVSRLVNDTSRHRLFFKALRIFKQQRDHRMGRVSPWASRGLRFCGTGQLSQAQNS